MSIQVVVPRALALAVLAAATPAAAAPDIVLTPPVGGAVSMTNAAGSMPRLRVGEDGTITMTGNFELGNSSSTQGNFYKNGLVFLHNNGGYATFVGPGAGNLGSAAHANNTGIGANALSSVTTGFYNVAVGSGALSVHTEGHENTAIGAGAMLANTSGGDNTASGYLALASNTVGYGNTAAGQSALGMNSAGDNNTGLGRYALFSNSTGTTNTAVGNAAMQFNTTGALNTAIGDHAGYNWTTGTGNIAISNSGIAGEGATTRIGQFQTKAFIAGVRGITTVNNNAIPVMIDGAGQLGTVSSSRAVKDDIADMEAASAALMKLRPVTFHYKSDNSRHLEYGLIAEEVAEVMPGLVAHSDNGRIETVMYQYLPPMLLNEYQKQQRRIEAQDAQIAKLEQRLASMADAMGQLIAERKKP